MKRHDKIHALTSLRFFAAFWVMLYHTMPRDDIMGRAVAPVIDLGYTAVSLFFILSGFILAKVYQRLRGRQNIIRFLMARCARIYPMYLLSLLIDVPRLVIVRAAKLGAGTAIMFTGATFAFQAAALQAWIPRFRALNFPSWSISTELFFYLIFPLVLPWTEHVVRDRDRILFMTLFVLANVAIALMLHQPHAPPGGVGEIWQNPILRLPEFMFGIFLAPPTANGTSVLLRRPWIAWSIPVIVSAGIATVIVTRPIFDDPRTSETLLTPVFGLAIVLLASTRNGLARAISGRLPVLLGEASYALYLLHVPIVALFLAAGLQPAHWWSPSYLAYVATTVMLSIALHLRFEHPARRYIMQMWATRTDREGRRPTTRSDPE